MAIEMTDEEFDILANAPYTGKETVCPRCGKKLIISGKDTSFMVKCEDPDCLELSMRGV